MSDARKSSRFDSVRGRVGSGGLPGISAGEWEVMRVVWGMGEATANEVVGALEGKRSWKPKTVHTMLRRLTDKGALGHEKRGREYVFRARVGERECQMAESRTFLGRVFGGDMAPFLAAFVEREELSAEEIAELKRILDEGSER